MELPISCLKKHRNAKIGKRNAYRSLQCNVLPLKTSQCDRISDLKKKDHYADSSLNGALVKRGTTVYSLLRGLTKNSRLVNSEYCHLKVTNLYILYYNQAKPTTTTRMYLSETPNNTACTLC